MTTSKPLTEEQLNAIEHWVNNSSSNPPEMMQRYVPMLLTEIRRQRAVLTEIDAATRRVEVRIDRVAEQNADLLIALEHLDDIIAGYEAEGIGPLLLAIRAAQKWRGVKSAGLTTSQDALGAIQSP